VETSEGLFRAVFEFGPDALFVLHHGEILGANAQAERLFGFGPGELVGTRSEALAAAGGFDDEERRRGQVVADPETRPLGTGMHLMSRRKDGTTFESDVSLAALRDEQGRDLVVISVRDASDRIEMEAENRRAALAEQRERAHRLESLGQLAGGIAHDFNNLLGVILNYATLLDRQITDPTASGDIAEIRAAADRAASLTRQLLTFARRDVITPEPLEVNEVVREAVSMLERTLGERIELRLDLEPRPLVAVFDRHQLEQIILNLAINARDAMDRTGVVTLGTRAEPAADGTAAVILTVGDDGPGMPPEVLERVFEPFFSTKPKGQGTGLGLSTVHGIVHQNGGDVSITSSIGLGTTVRVLMVGSSNFVPVSAADQRAEGAGSERILLVEDEEALREGTARLLQSRGYDVVTASDGVDALAIMDREERPIDMVVTDVAMPRMRGDELHEHLAGSHPALPVLFMSGYDSGASELPGRLLPKPVLEHELLTAIREMLDG
jgi:two-component system, cell cycle sensor histidine kinase and response regulator CckA